MINRVGKRFGLLEVIQFDKKCPRNGMRWFCRCDCGTVKSIIYNSLMKGRSTSCGCVARLNASKKMTVHGMASTPTYKSWHAMKQRCEGKGGHESYVERGINIDPRWESFEAFITDMGVRPDGKTLDRIDNTKGYSKENCRWADAVQQMNNRSVSRLFEVDGGEFLSIPQISRKYGIGISKLRHCIRKGQSIDEAMQDQKWKNKSPRKGYLKPDGTFVKEA